MVSTRFQTYVKIGSYLQCVSLRYVAYNSFSVPSYKIN